MMSMNTYTRVCEIGYGLTDAKVTTSRDLNFEVAGIRIQSKQGEMVNLPRWVGHILQDGKLAELESPDMITELKQALSKEKMVGEYQISTLNHDFYIKLKESMKRLDRHDFDNVESIMMELFRMRRGKLVKIADSSKLTADLNSRLTVEERIFFESIGHNSRTFEQQIRGSTR